MKRIILVMLLLALSSIAATAQDRPEQVDGTGAIMIRVQPTQTVILMCGNSPKPSLSGRSIIVREGEVIALHCRH